MPAASLVSSTVGFFHRATIRHHRDKGADGERPLTLSALGTTPGNETAALGQPRVQHRVPSAERRIDVARAAPVGRPSLAVSQWQTPCVRRSWPSHSAARPRGRGSQDPRVAMDRARAMAEAKAPRFDSADALIDEPAKARRQQAGGPAPAVRPHRGLLQGPGAPLPLGPDWRGHPLNGDRADHRGRRIGGDSLPISRPHGRGMICASPGSRADLFEA